MPRLQHLPASVRRANITHSKMLQQQAYERRLKARLLLFGNGGGKLENLKEVEKAVVRGVFEEAYQNYLHLFRTGIDTRYPRSWTKRRQIRLQNDKVPLNRRRYWIVWFGSQKVRYTRFDLPAQLKANLELIRA